MRLRMAEGILSTTPLPVKEVAAEVGYRYVGNFTRDFHGLYNNCPDGGCMQAEVYAANVTYAHFGNYAFCALVSNPLGLPPGYTQVYYSPQEIDAYWDGSADAFSDVAMGGSWCAYLLSATEMTLVNGPMP
jgi:hypothetical protein